MVFVLQQAGMSALGGQLDHHEGSELGYYYEPTNVFDPSIGIEIDIYNNNGIEPFLYYDPPEIGTHITLVKHGHPTPITEIVEISPEINNCEDRLFRVAWNSSTKKLAVYLDGSQVLSYTEDIVSTVFKDDPMVYFGFTGATGGLSALQTFCNTAISYEGPLTSVEVDYNWPYTLFGDTPSDAGQDNPIDYLGQHWEPGVYKMKATPYWKGREGTGKTISFSVTGSDTEQASTIAVYPIPTTGVVHINPHEAAIGARMVLLDDRGNVLLSEPLQATVQLDLSSFKKGIYYLKFISLNAVQMKRIVVE